MMRSLKESQDAASRQQTLHATKGRSEIVRRMENIGCDNHVEGAIMESLFLKFPVDVKEPIMDKLILGELTPRPAEKEFGKIGEPVFDLSRRQQGKDRRSGASGSTSDLQNSQTLPPSRNLRRRAKS